MTTLPPPPPPTTSTSPDATTTVPAPAPAEHDLVGLIGCSMTVDAVEGYARLGGEAMWSVEELGYGQGAVARWSEVEGQGGYWRRFDAALERQPSTDAVWWELCTSGSRRDNLEQALTVLSMLEERLPSAPIYVSAQPAYTDGHVCDLAESDGPDLMGELASELVTTGRVLPGPELSPLEPEQLVDTCHGNADGKRQMGEDLIEFFGK